MYENNLLCRRTQFYLLTTFLDDTINYCQGTSRVQKADSYIKSDKTHN